MFDWSGWFRGQLAASADGFLWAFARVDPGRREQLPVEPGYLGTWPPARHVWHVAEYERCLALPAMRLWLGGPMPGDDAWPDTEEAWAAVTDRSPERLSAAFRRVRQEQIALIDALTDADWEALRPTPWGERSLAWIVTKTYQHTFEHGDTLLRMGLWWDIIARAMAAGTPPP